MKDFEKFKKCFKKYQEKFGLNGYTVYYEYKPIDNCFANITIDQMDMVATTRLNSQVKKDDKPFKNVARSAKHEALHLLLSKVEHLSKCRYTNEEEINEDIEEIVHKLENLID